MLERAPVPERQAVAGLALVSAWAATAGAGSDAGSDEAPAHWRAAAADEGLAQNRRAERR